MLPNDAFRMWRYEAIGSPPTIAMIAPEISSATTSAPSVRAGDSQRGDGQPRLEADRHAGSPLVAPSRRVAATGFAGRRLGAAGHQQPDVRDVRLVARERPDDPALVDHVDAVRQGEDLVELLRDQQDRRALRAQVEQQPVDGLDRARRRARASAGRRRAAAGSVSISRARISRWRLPPDRSRTCVSTDGAAIRYDSFRSLGDPARRVVVDEPAAGDRRVAVALHDQVVGQRQVRGAADARPVLRHVGDAAADDRARRTGWRRGSPPTRTSPAARPEAGDDLGQLALAVAGDRRDPDDLARAHVERHLAQRRQPPVVLGRHALDREHDLARLERRACRRPRGRSGRPSAAPGRPSWPRPRARPPPSPGRGA